MPDRVSDRYDVAIGVKRENGLANSGVPFQAGMLPSKEASNGGPPMTVNDKHQVWMYSRWFQRMPPPNQACAVVGMKPFCSPESLCLRRWVGPAVASLVMHELVDARW